MESLSNIEEEMRECANAADPSIWGDERIAGLVRNYKAQQFAYLDRINVARRRDEVLMFSLMLFAVEDYVESWASVAYKACVHAACVRLGLEYQPNGPGLQEQIEARIKAMEGATDEKSE